MRSIASFKRGFTTIEILVVLGIMALLGSVVLSAFGEYRSRQAKDAVVEGALSLLAEARLDTISSKYDDTYGIRLKSNEVIYFKGATYPGDTDVNNIHFAVPTSIELGSVTLAGGGDQIFYQRLSGKTDQYGTFEVRVKNNPSIRTIITISQTGASSI